MERAKLVVEGKLIKIKERAGADVRVQGFKDEGGGGVEVAVNINDQSFVILGRSVAGQGVLEEADEELDAGIVDLRGMAFGGVSAFLATGMPVLGKAVESVKAVKAGSGILEKRGPIAHGVAASDAKFEVEDFFVRNAGGDLVKKVAATAGLFGDLEALLAHPVADLEVVDRGLEKLDGGRAEAGADTHQKGLDRVEAAVFGRRFVHLKGNDFLKEKRRECCNGVNVG